jgi:hypothetical protein
MRERQGEAGREARTTLLARRQERERALCRYDETANSTVNDQRSLSRVSQAKRVTS